MANKEEHIRKRPFQSSITSYFTRSQTVDGSPSLSDTTSSSLPHDVQVNLLNAGMRTRKAVKDGYKTHKTVLASPAPVQAEPSPRILVTNSYPSSNELQPFCGLHKTGGWASQSISPWRDSEEGLSKLATSQSTLGSTQSSFFSETYDGVKPVRNNKRSFNEDMEECMDNIFDVERISASNARRKFAMPKGHYRKPKADTHHNIRGHGDDFEDASFLEPPDDMELEFSLPSF